MQTVQKVALVFTIIGAIAWGLIGLFNFNIVEALFGVDTIIAKVVYVIVGLAGIINIGLLLMPFEETGRK